MPSRNFDLSQTPSDSILVFPDVPPTPPSGQFLGAVTASTKFAQLGFFNPGAVYVPFSGGTLTGPLILAADPVVALGAATKQYTDKMLPLAGGQMAGPLALAGDATLPLQAATKQQVDLKLPITGGTLTGFLVLNADPQNALQAATKQYVDGHTDAQIALCVPLIGGTMTGPLVLGSDAISPTAWVPLSAVPYMPVTYEDQAGNIAAGIDAAGVFRIATAVISVATITTTLNFVAPFTIGAETIKAAPLADVHFLSTEEDTAGNIVRAVGTAGLIAAPPAPERRASNKVPLSTILTTSIPKLSSSSYMSNTTAGITISNIWTLEDDFDWVRLIYLNDYLGYTLSGYCVSPAAQIGNAMDPLDGAGVAVPWAIGTMNNGGVDLPYYAQNAGAVTSFVFPSYTPPPITSGIAGTGYFNAYASDWVNVGSLPRIDGRAGRLLFTRSYITGAHTRASSVVAHAIGASSASNRRDFYANTATGDFVSSPANQAAMIGATPAASQFFSPFAVQYVLRNGRGATLFVTGDSIGVGNGTDQTTAYAGLPNWLQWQLSRFGGYGPPVALCMAAAGGATDYGYVAAAQTLLPLIKPNAMELQTWSRNTPDQPAWTQADADRQWAAARDLITVANAWGCVPILATPPPNSSMTTTTDAYRISAVTRTRAAQSSGAVVFDWEPVLGTGATPNAMQPSLTNDGVHPNDAGQQLMMAIAVRKLRSMLDI